MAAKILDGKALAATLREKLTTEVAAFTAASGIIPHLVVIIVGADPASQVYVRNKQKGCEQVGMKSTLMPLPATTTQTELLDIIHQLNADPGVNGILVQLPLPKQISEEKILDSIHPLKDVDAFHPENVGMLVQGRPRFLPCTPAGCVELIKLGGIETSGAHAVVLGRSEIVGKPMAMLLIQKGPYANATVTVCHSRTKDLAKFTREADILIAAIGIPNFVKADMVKEGVVVIDVGINRIESGLVGDVDYNEVSGKASAITPVPGGVGPMTVTMLLQNTLQAAKLQSH
jgi:methylenetetrahydrofolate dehydrogenase (NADP+)/methenyltetrahydrofolate cyclohydrolase